MAPVVPYEPVDDPVTGVVAVTPLVPYELLYELPAVLEVTGL